MAPHPAPPFDLFNVYFEQIYDPTMHLLLTFDGAVDEETLRAATLRLIAANPYLGCRFAVREGVPVWEEIPEEEWGRGFEVLTPGAAMPPARLDVRTGPQVRVSLLQEDGGDRVVVTCHHGFCDARGLLDLARDLFAACRGVPPAPTGLYDRSTDPVLARFSAAEIEGACEAEAPFVDRWRFPVERTGRGAPRIACRTLGPERLAGVRAFGKAHGATVNDVVLAAVFLAMLEIRGDPADLGAPRGILTSADLRRYLDRPVPPANLSIAYEVTVSAGEGAGLEEVVGQVAAATKRRKANGLGPGCIRFYEGIYAGGVPAVKAFFDGMMGRYMETALKNPVFSNIGVIDEGVALPLAGEGGRPLDLRSASIIPCVCWPYGFLISLSTFRDAMTIASAYEEGPYAPETVERFLDLIDRCLP